ncbi:hypothetical protein [Streptomyces ochraceiscleroticus]|uniref:Uncharacterized protein n=1 Tax=Streptomyces ochraceiscleroticus TaxID=47761 RepID=A0ABW1MEG9_9ACTN|nr:hypothetical protein [Streptomyces ochraceiscleroticus]
MQSSATGDTAWQHSATRRAWKAGLALHLLVVPFGVVAGGFAVARLPIPTWLRCTLAVLLVIAGIYGVCRQVSRVRQMFRLRRILRIYPWQVYESGLPHSAGVRSAHGSRAWFKVPSPDNPNSWEQCYVYRTRRSRWWLERMPPQAGREAKADIRTLWVVGDPRFRAVLAVPGKCGPRRMLELPAGGSRAEHLANASPEALIRAVKAGVRLPELAIPAMESDRGPVVPAPEPPSGAAWAFPATRWSMRLRLLRGAAVLAAAPVPFLWLFSLGPWHASSAKGLVFVLAGTVIPAFRRLRSSFILRRTLRSRGTPWRTLDVEIRHRGRALVLVTGNEALRTQLALRRLPAGRAQVWYVGDIYGAGVVSLRGDGAVMPVRCTEHGRPVAKPKAAASEERPRVRRWGPVG